MVLVQLTVFVLTWLLLTLGWPRNSVPPNPPSKSPSPRPDGSVMDLEEEEEVAEDEDDDEEDDEWEVPGTLETVAGDELEPSSSKINSTVFTWKQKKTHFENDRG